MTERLPLFVFGTLRRGHRNHHFLDGRYERVTEATLPDYTRVEPLMVAPRRGQSVDGELFTLKASGYQQTLQECDRLEGIPAGKTAGLRYRRVKLNVQTDSGQVEAWVYVQA